MAAMSTTPSAPGRPRDPEVDRRIAEAALDVFGDAGWAGFAMEAVAKRAGVGKASLYLRWSNMEALLTDALTAGLPQAGATVADVTGVLATHVHFDHHGLSDWGRSVSGAWVGMHPAE